MIVTDFFFLLILIQAVSQVGADTNSTFGEQDTTNTRTSFIQGAKTIASAAAEGIDKTIKKPLRDILGIDCVEPTFECPNENVTFWYYPSPEVNSSVEISVSDPRTFDHIERNNRKWKVLIHGYSKSKNDIPNPELRAAYQTQGEGHHILSVDYQPLAREPCYIPAVHNVPLISKCVAQFLDELIDRGYLKLENLHVIGYSLGAQISGRIYEFMRNGRPPRVTALDPAGILFDGKIIKRVTTDSADFVDVIHTNGLGMGMFDQGGHIDFYVNGGTTQPGCVMKDVFICSHDRSPLVYAESINSAKGFWGLPCSNPRMCAAGKYDTDEQNFVIMGEYTPNTARGVYYVKTRDKPPYALGKVTQAFITES